MAREVEHKFLLRGDGRLGQAGAGTQYRQGYFFVFRPKVAFASVCCGEAKITLTGNSQGPARDEFEYSIPERDGLQMVERLYQKPLIEKTRYEIWRDGVKWEIDEFADENQGLIVRKVETDQPSQEISKADWVGQEITGDPRYFDVNLVRQPYSQWRQLVGG